LAGGVILSNPISNYLCTFLCRLSLLQSAWCLP